MRKDKVSTYSTSNIDSGLLDKFQNIESDSDIISFIQNQSLIKLLNNWSYFLTVNDHKQFISISKKLNRITNRINQIIHYDSTIKKDGDDTNNINLSDQLKLLELKPQINDFYKDLINNHIKTINKTFYNFSRGNLINPSLIFLQDFINYNNHSLINEFINNFDTNSSNFIKISSTTNKIIRTNFIKFWILLLSNVSSFIRKDLLMNYKIMNNFWKFIDEDNFEIWIMVCDFINDKIINDSNFKKSTKCKILNENFLFKFIQILSKIDNPLFNSTVKDKYHSLINLLVTDFTNGLVYIQQIDNGVPITINNKIFKINNKIIYTLLTFLKPWEFNNHCQFVITILNSNQELIGPYMNWIVSNGGGYHDPSLTSWWIGHTYLYNQILNLSLNSKNNEDFESILLAPLSKSSIIKCLELKKKLINQLILQIIYLQLNKLNNSSSSIIISIVLNHLPSLNLILPFLNDENKIIKLTAIMIINKLENLKPSLSTQLSKLIENNINKVDLVNKFDLILLDNYISIQSNNDEFKWYNKQGSNSFFTNLIKLSKINLLNLKIFNILIKLVKNLLIFNTTNLIESPILPLCQLPPPNDDIAKLLDETIARSIKFPYKYLDKSHDCYQDLSLFVIVLFEQFKFIEQSQENKSWLIDFCKQLIIIGEPELPILELLGEQKNLSFDDLPSNFLPINKFQFGQLLKQLTKFNKNDDIIDIFTKLGNYIMSDNSLHHFITTKNFWGKFFDNFESNDSKILIIHLLNELFQQIDSIKSNSNDFNQFIYNNLQSTDTNEIYSKFCWVLSNNQLIEVSSNFNNQSLNQIYQEILDRKIIIKQPNFEKLINLPNFEKILIHFKIPLDLIKHDLVKYNYLLKNVNEDELIQLNNTDSDDILYLLGSTSVKYLELNHDLIIPIALSLKDFEKSLKIFNNGLKYFDVNQLQTILFNYINNDGVNNLKHSFNPEFIKLLLKLSSSIQINEWVFKSMLYITKKFAESTNLSSNFNNFLIEFDNLNIFQYKIPMSIINTQLEVILSSKNWINESIYLKHVSSLINSKSIQYEKLIQIFINNEHNALNKLPNLNNESSRFESGLIIHKLFNLNITKNSSEILLENLLLFYLGSTRKEDYLIKSILVSIEDNISKTWINKITNWDFQDELSSNDIELVGQEKLFIKDKSNFIISINKNFIMNSIKHFNSPSSYDYNDTIYDSEFLLMIIINNEEFLSEVVDETDNNNKIKFNLKKLIDSNLLQFLIVNLSNANEYITNIVKVIIQGLLKSINDQDFKDKNIFQVYLCNIINTLRNPQYNHNNLIIWYNYSNIISILNNPGHFLYEKVFRYVLSNPIINEIPLYKDIINPSLEDESSGTINDQYYRQVNWLVDSLIDGAKTEKDLNIIKSKKIIEWIMNLYNSLYVPDNIKQNILRFIYTIQFINNGSDLLITRFSILSDLEMIKDSLIKQDLISIHDEQLSLNIDQIMIRFGLILQNNKRIADWTAGDLTNVIKRIHTDSI